MKRDFLFQWAAQFASASRESFISSHPESFLVWEPGPWVPRGAGITTRAHAPGQPPRPNSLAEKPVVIPLLFPAGSTRLLLGRDAHCEVAINDGTLSRNHLALCLGPGAAITVEDLGSRNGSWLNNQTLQPNQKVALNSGDQLQAGSVFFTFLTPPTLFDRLRTGR